MSVFPLTSQRRSDPRKTVSRQIPKAYISLRPSHLRLDGISPPPSLTLSLSSIFLIFFFTAVSLGLVLSHLVRSLVRYTVWGPVWGFPVVFFLTVQRAEHAPPRFSVFADTDQVPPRAPLADRTLQRRQLHHCHGGRVRALPDHVHGGVHGAPGHLADPLLHARGAGPSGCAAGVFARGPSPRADVPELYGRAVDGEEGAVRCWQHALMVSEGRGPGEAGAVTSPTSSSTTASSSSGAGAARGVPGQSRGHVEERHLCVVVVGGHPALAA